MVAAAAVGAIALIPAGAQAATRSVSMGTPANAQSKFQASGTDVNDFFPHRTTIHVGDKVRFVPTGFHTVDIPAKGATPAGLIVPDGKIIAGINDAAGSPFWFNGQPELNFNPVLFASLYGKKLTFNAKKGLQTGLPLAAKPKPVVVKFKKAGKITYYCTVHPGMTGVLNVKRRKAHILSARKHRKAVRAQVKRDLKIAKGLTKHAVPAGTVDVGEAGAHGVEYFGMLPGTITVPAGTTLKFTMTPKSYEAHTATFGPGNPETEPDSYLGVMAKSFEGPLLDQRALYPSDPPPAIASLTPASHGNGFWNSGAIDASGATPLPMANSVKFDAPGTYAYYCLIHPFMKGEVVVQ
jgi:plastocyanin